MKNMIIGVGNAGCQIVKMAALSSLLNEVEFYAIDSVVTTIDMDSMSNIKFIPIVSDEKSGSGRSRERGKAMYEFHEAEHAFDEMYKVATEVKSPVIVVTSAAGGTGSGSVVPLCKALMEREVDVIPIIVCPNKKDPAAFHLNTSDLFMDLSEIGIETYALFENKKGDADYTPINTEVVEMMELLFGKRYDKTDLDSIDDSDLDRILGMPGRIMAVQAEASSLQVLQKEITRKLFVGSQPIWKPEEVQDNTLMTAFALKSMFADVDFKSVFGEIDRRIDSEKVFDNYRNIVMDDNDGIFSASVIIAGLPRSEIKEIKGEYKGTSGIGAGINRGVRPTFMKQKKATVVDVKSGNDTIRKFKWTK
ncbi:MAG: hypothetical protein J5614_06920 [Paludibacteraceae bacterium]|nr:hypothetical protein [Paludibacteraceae bacterium]